MDNSILNFLDAYKNLDEMCKQVLLSENGVSDYIKEMESNPRGYGLCVGWKWDYQQLKKMRYIRNKLVHEPNSFELSLFSSEDVQWLRDFRERFFQQTDPLALLYKAVKNKNKIHMQQKNNTPNVPEWNISSTVVGDSNDTKKKDEKNRENIGWIVALLIVVMVALIIGIGLGLYIY